MALPQTKPGSGGYQILFWALAALLVLRPVIEEVAEGPWIFASFFTAVLLSSAWAVSQKRSQLIGLAILGLITVGSVWTDLRPEITSLAAMLYLGWITVILAVDVFRDRARVSADMVFGAVNVYLLIGVTFAMAHWAQTLLVPGSISGLNSGSEFGDTLYYSFVTLTTLGYGDISPVSDNARMLAVFEAVLGQLYIAVLLARLVAVHISSKTKEPTA